jgi:carboxylesterase type B
MIYLALLCLLSLSVTSFEIPTTIQTNLGDVLGVRHTESFTKKPIYEFRKIPYAKPPVGKLRFTRPKPYGRWLGTLDALKNPNIPRR